MSLIKCLSKMKKEAMDPYPSSILVHAQLDPIYPTIPHDPLPQSPENLGTSPSDIEDFMN